MTDDKPKNLMDGILSEMNRARDVLKMYEEIPQGVFGAIRIRQSIAAAEKAIASGDIIQMIKSYKELQEIE